MNPPQRYRTYSPFQPFFGTTVTMAANTVIPENNLVALDANGRAVLASDTAGLTIAGVASGLCDNTVAGNSNRFANCLRGIFRYPNSRTAPVTAADLGQPVFVEDERTIAKTTTNSVVAGVAIGLEDTVNGGAGFHVWLCVGPIGTLPGSPTLGSVPPAPPAA